MENRQLIKNQIDRLFVYLGNAIAQGDKQLKEKIELAILKAEQEYAYSFSPAEFFERTPTFNLIQLQDLKSMVPAGSALQEFINCDKVVKIAEADGIELSQAATNRFGDTISACDYCNLEIALEPVGKKTICPILNKNPHLKGQIAKIRS